MQMGSKPQHMSIQHARSTSHDATLQHLKDITYNFSAEKILGRGGSSVVYKVCSKHIFSFDEVFRHT